MTRTIHFNIKQKIGTNESTWNRTKTKLKLIELQITNWKTSYRRKVHEETVLRRLPLVHTVLIQSNLFTWCEEHPRRCLCFYILVAAPINL